MTAKADFLALAFGALLVLLTFGDNHLGRMDGNVTIGNLDTIFGIRLWPVLDVIYPLATIAVFLLYGLAKGGRLRITWKTFLLFVTFLLALALMIIDDLAIGLHRPIQLSYTYWVLISWIYPIYSGIAFFYFGRLHSENENRSQS